MIKRYEVEQIITDALEDLNGLLSKPDNNNKCTVYEANVEDKGDGELIFYFKEDMASNNKPDKYRIKIDYME